MKSMHIIASTIVAVALLSGCSREEPTPTPITAPESTRPLEQNQNIDNTRDQNNQTTPYTNPQNQGTGSMDDGVTTPDDTDADINGSESMYDNNTPTNNSTTPGTTQN